MGTGTRFEAPHFVAIPDPRAGGLQRPVAAGRLPQRVLVAGAHARGSARSRRHPRTDAPFDPHQET
jgi:hypothetical protein